MPRKVQELSEQIDSNALPAHIAIIMDGNGRWARKRGLPRVAGHRAGINAVRQVVIRTISGSARSAALMSSIHQCSAKSKKELPEPGLTRG